MAAFDVTMARTISDPESPLYWDTIGGCCITPPIGHALEHESGTRGRAMGAKKTGQQSMHWSRWQEKWCIGGTRGPAGKEITGMRKLISMPRPREEVVYGSEGLDMRVLAAELSWRTELPEDLGIALGVFAPAPPGEPERERAAPAGQDAPEGSAAVVARMIVGNNLPKNWHKSALRGEIKQLMRRLRLLDFVQVPLNPLMKHTAPGYRFDAHLGVLSLPQRMNPREEESDATFFFRAYELPYDPVSFLAFKLSMIEGRAGRGLARTHDELTAPWANPAACAALINLCTSQSTQ